ncbi:hypothetical protein CL656_04790 [bacterium]|nr:hypothetical protein [bacterium]
MKCLKYICFCTYFKKTKPNDVNEYYSLEQNINTYRDKNKVWDPFKTNDKTDFYINDECFFCLEKKYTGECVKINCCNDIVHSECFIQWCLTNNKMLCPLCHKSTDFHI